jgi:hypothetical protein
MSFGQGFGGNQGGSPFGANNPFGSDPFGNAPHGGGFGAPPPGVEAPPPAGAPAADVDLQGVAPEALPNYCACCMGAPSGALTVARSQTRGRTTVTRKILVPYCQRCMAHVQARTRRNVALGLVALLVSLPAPLLLAWAWSYAPAALIVATGLVVSTALSALLGAVVKAPPVAREQGCCADHPAVAIRRFAPASTRLRVYNPAYARQLAGMYGAQPVPASPRAPTSARWVWVPILSLLAGIPAYFATHGTVYFDNPSAVPLTFDVDDGARSVTVQPGQHDHVDLPAGDHQVAVQMNGQAVDRFDGDVDAFTDHVATPLGTACYARLTTTYGTAQLTAADGERMQAGQRWYALSGVDYVLAPFPRTITANNHQTGARKVRFARVDCRTGAPTE